MKEKIVVAMLSTVMTTLLLGVLATLQPGWIIGALGGVTEEELQKVRTGLQKVSDRTHRIFYTVDDATHIKAGSFQFSFHTDGKFIVYDYGMNVVFHSSRP